VIEQSTITYPKCGHDTVEHTPMNACQFFYDCKECGERFTLRAFGWPLPRNSQRVDNLRKWKGAPNRDSFVT
jgi:hypothetical protein